MNKASYVPQPEMGLSCPNSTIVINDIDRIMYVCFVWGKPMIVRGRQSFYLICFDLI